MLIEEIVKLVGPVPTGFEEIAWLCGFFLLLWLSQHVVSVIYAVLSWVGGHK